MSEVKVKLCGLRRAEDIAFANEAQPDYIGFVFAPKSRRAVTAVEARALREQLSAGIIPVGVFVNQPVELVAQLLNDGVIDWAQLHGQEDESYLTALRRLTAKPILQAFRVETQADVVRAAASSADGILLDNGAGGTGEAFDWSLVRDCDRPFFLAGGLTPENVAEAIAQVRPYAVDTSSGVETAGWKDREKMRRFVQAVRAAG
ncbi:MAG: phosphoribosylanthranilate isomerase [Candidatus Onthomonas sp.]|nr:phosphoribosylanthranilate isomerase [Candidatus Onthomonas sp.]